MLKLFLLTFLYIFSFAQNPTIYSLLGDVIYNNSDEIEKLSEIAVFSEDKEKISDYVMQCEALKEKGFSIESGETKYDKSEYLNSLRKLSKQNDQFVRLANSKFRNSIQSDDIQTFKALVDMNIINKSIIKSKVNNFILNHEFELQDSIYYTLYKADLEKERLEQAHLKKIREANKKKEKLSKIERIREKDKNRQESLKKELEKMVEDKKKQIYKEQKEELQNY
ncbi:hypothetical protein KKA17_04745 [bacterium]|nr:hypothetical protein [bacterium]MBU1884296.1 hypothetical protein [bacterium]